MENHASRGHIARTFGALAIASAIPTALTVVRLVHTGAHTYSYLIWNLFLAWVPLLLSGVLYASQTTRLWRHVLVPILGIFWLLFYPNALYIVTDLLHLSAKDGVPVWYDLVLLLSYAWTGLLAGFVSLTLIQSMVVRAWGRVAGWLFGVGVLGLSGFAVYLGRFLRWNSWDVIIDPIGVANTVLYGLLHPAQHVRPLAVSAAFATFFIATYLTLAAFARLRQEVH